MEERDENNLHSGSNAEHGETQSPQAGGQVMDVTAPQLTGNEPQSPSQETAPASSENDNSQSPDTGQSRVDNSSSEPATDVPAPQAESSPDVYSAESSNEQPLLGSHEQPIHGHKPPHSGMPIMAIAIAVVVAIVLAGLVVFAYTRNSSGDIDRKDTTGIYQPITEKPQATTADVDETNKEIDAGLEKANDTADFPESELSDASLGL